MTPSSKPTPGTDLSDEEAAGRPERAGGATAAQILIVEDDFLISLELELRLIDAGFSVVGIAVTAGRQCPWRVRSDRSWLSWVFGWRTARTVSKRLTTLGIRSIFVSAHADAETRKRAAPASAVGWLQKPYPAEALIRLIPAYLSDPSA
jgi:CheY-like chemotaxis protein